jgi:hypothetical protein
MASNDTTRESMGLAIRMLERNIEERRKTVARLHREIQATEAEIEEREKVIALLRDGGDD